MVTIHVISMLGAGNGLTAALQLLVSHQLLRPCLKRVRQQVIESGTRHPTLTSECAYTICTTQTHTHK